MDVGFDDLPRRYSLDLGGYATDGGGGFGRKIARYSELGRGGGDGGGVQARNRSSARRTGTRIRLVEHRLSRPHSLNSFVTAADEATRAGAGQDRDRRGRTGSRRSISARVVACRSRMRFPRATAGIWRW